MELCRYSSCETALSESSQPVRNACMSRSRTEMRGNVGSITIVSSFFHRRQICLVSLSLLTSIRLYTVQVNSSIVNFL